MTAVAYCMRDLHGSDKTPPGAVCVPQSSGGCGVPHEATKTDDSGAGGAAAAATPDLGACRELEGATC